MCLASFVLFTYTFSPSAALVQSDTPLPLTPNSFRWQKVPGDPALQAAWVIGSEQKPGPYILRVKLADEGKLPPHTHPDERSSTVLAGTLYIGFGKDFDESKVVAIPAGAVYVTPANTPHYVWAKERRCNLSGSRRGSDGNIIHWAVGDRLHMPVLAPTIAGDSIRPEADARRRPARVRDQICVTVNGDLPSSLHHLLPQAPCQGRRATQTIGPRLSQEDLIGLVFALNFNLIRMIRNRADILHERSPCGSIHNGGG